MSFTRSAETHTFKAHIRRHLSQEAKGCGYLVLWLDCDREGENICYEGILYWSNIVIGNNISVDSQWDYKFHVS